LDVLKEKGVKEVALEGSMNAVVSQQLRLPLMLSHDYCGWLGHFLVSRWSIMDHRRSSGQKTNCFNAPVWRTHSVSNATQRRRTITPFYREQL